MGTAASCTGAGAQHFLVLQHAGDCSVVASQRAANRGVKAGRPARAIQSLTRGAKPELKAVKG